jgi:hypothetical protein
MRKAFGNSSRPMRARALVLALTVAAVTWMCACSGNAHFTPSSTSAPAPGVTLQQIKITPASSIILLAETRQLFAEGVYSDGTTEDISSSVTWSTSPSSATSAVSVSSGGVATGDSIGATAVTASLGSVTGVLQLTVGTNGFSSSTLAILAVPHGTSEIDVAYLPQQTKINGSYAVQEVDLDADKLSSFLPVPVALISSIAMPGGYVPNAAVASPNNNLVAVISYTSPNIQVIDASNNPNDVASNTLIATYPSPVTQSVTVNGTSCMICAAVVNPTNDQLILSTAQGFYSMNLSTGAFTQIPFSPAPASSANITVDPVATPDPFILSTVAGAGEIQILDLTTNAVTTYPNVGVTPTAGFVDLATQFSGVVDGSASDQTLIDFTHAQTPVISTLQGVGVCPGGSAYMNMASLGVPANAVASAASHYLFTGQTNGNCVGFAGWPSSGVALEPGNIVYGYGPMPSSPDGNTFVSGSDPNEIATFTSVFDKNLYGLLIEGSQQWLAKINLGSLNGDLSGFADAELPAGVNLSGQDDLIAGIAGDPIVFLPTPSTQLTLSETSLAFGTVTVGTQGTQSIVTLTNISEAILLPQISLQGPNSGDFLLMTSCTVALQPVSNCGVTITFTPTATGTRSAVLNVVTPGSPTQTVQLSGSGQ